MVVASPRSKKTKAVGVPTIDLSLPNHKYSLSDQIVSACEEYGIFKVVNHGIPSAAIAALETQTMDFFRQPDSFKQLSGPPNPFGYGSRNIGPNGDMGHLEYLLLHANIPSTHPPNFSCEVKDYVGAVVDLACDVLDLMAEGLWVADKSIFSRLIRDVQSDSLLRLNHYPPSDCDAGEGERIGFGEHSDPQILTVLRSNDVAGLQICMPDGLWLPVAPDPNAFYVMVGDALQVLTNGRLLSVKHKAIANMSSSKARLSTIFFGAPPLNAVISPIKEMVSALNPSLYTPFTWDQYKRAMRASKLSDCRLNQFKRRLDDNNKNNNKGLSS